MIPSASARFQVIEYASPAPLIAPMASALGCGREAMARLVTDRGARIALTLGATENPLTVAGLSISAQKVAGVVRLAPYAELEIAPKFLGVGDAAEGWREDFFFIAVLSKHGHLLELERISASTQQANDLSSLIAQAITGMYWQEHRRPIRTYRRFVEHDFFLDGDVDPFDLVLPGPDGYPQERLRFTSANRPNAILSAAAGALHDHVRSPSLAAGLSRVQDHLGKQPRLPRGALPRSRLSGRSRAWQPLMDLAVDTLNGMGLGFAGGPARAPGFVVSTWQLWQDLLTIAARLAFRPAYVRAEQPVALGGRYRSDGQRQGRLNVHPDIEVALPGLPRFIVDAKYKGRVDRLKLHVAESDVYEAMAFSRACGGCAVILAYPSLATMERREPGTITPIETIRIEGAGPIVAVHVEARGISQIGGLTRFVQNLRHGLLERVMENI